KAPDNAKRPKPFPLDIPGADEVNQGGENDERYENEEAQHKVMHRAFSQERETGLPLKFCVAYGIEPKFRQQGRVARG
ncbi:hypothetical protein, partial [Staphylococcus aureus]